MKFYKYQGTGNDFILIDNRKKEFVDTGVDAVAHLCNRHFGIGADGLILLTEPEAIEIEKGMEREGAVFGMDYFNSDGRRSSMCGNGGRCLTDFARRLGIVNKDAKFIAIDGLHEALFTDFGVKLKMTMPTQYKKIAENEFFIHTGSPHYVRFLGGGPFGVFNDLDGYNLRGEGRQVRNLPEYAPGGTNANFVIVLEDGRLKVRTYERGVEAETLSCGTGVTAVAEVWSRLNDYKESPVNIETPGGKLRVHTAKGKAPWLEGPATFVFEGTLPQ